MKKYSSYTASDIKWIGSYPSHWRKMSLRRITDSHKQGYYSTDEYKSDGFKLVRITDLDSNGNIDITNAPFVHPNESEQDIFQIKKGDVLFPRTGSIGLLGIAKEDMKAVFASYLIRFRFNANTSSKFMKHYFLSDVFINGILSDLHGGVNQNIHAENIKDQAITLPPLEEQIQIARYLDYKTNEIETLIANKQKLIELLREERTATINHAVTKGINPKVKLKPSGIDWLGDIPAHWEVKKLRYVFENKNQMRVPLSAEERGRMDERIYDYYGASGVIDQVENYIFDEPLILIGEDGANLLTRSKTLAFIASGKYWVNNHAHIIKPINGNIHFLAELLEIIDYKIYVTGSAQPKLTQEALMSIKIVDPPRSEQDEIWEFLKSEQDRIDTIIAKIEQEIELLNEYKTALISEVVTGKVDVRDEKIA
jgi:type I restriction enzyme S subunit